MRQRTTIIIGLLALVIISTQSAVTTCESQGPDFFKFMGKVQGVLGRGGLPFSFEISTPCFKLVKFTQTKTGTDSLQINVEARNPILPYLCIDTFLIASAMNQQIAPIFTEGSHLVEFKRLNENQLENIQYFGIHIFRTCDSAFNLPIDALMTAGMFLPLKPGKPKFWIDYLARKFAEHVGGYTWKKREPIKTLDIDPNLIHSGDFIAITRIDGVDQLIQVGTGATPGHSAVAMWKDGELYILESQEDVPYWPRGKIQRNKWKDWIKLAEKADYNVAILPMKEQIRKRFNVEKAWKWQENGIEGLPYGIHNFIFGWIDTEFDNFPPIMEPEWPAIIFSIMEKISPALVKAFIGEALNKRLGTKDLTLPEILTETQKRNLTIGKLFALKENDEWIYSDGKAMVCSSFVAAIYKAGGIFQSYGISDEQIQATEFTPKDVVSLKFWDDADKRPEICKKADPDLPYCQLMGRQKFEMAHGYNNIVPYPHMNENCPSKSPDYFRPEGC